MLVPLEKQVNTAGAQGTRHYPRYKTTSIVVAISVKNATISRPRGRAAALQSSANANTEIRTIPPASIGTMFALRPNHHACGLVQQVRSRFPAADEDWWIEVSECIGTPTTVPPAMVPGANIPKAPCVISARTHG